MAFTGGSGLVGFSAGGPRAKGGFSMQVYGLTEIQKGIAEVERGMKTQANREMRAASKDIAQKILMPELHRTAQASPMELSRRYADTMRPLSDRVVGVAVGARLPNLSGLKRGIGAAKGGEVRGAYSRQRTTRNYATTLAWASEFGPYPGSSINRYGVPRREGGYWAQIAVDNKLDDIVDRWRKALSDMLLKYSRYR